MARRTKAREVALQMLFQQDLNPDVQADTVRELMGKQIREEPLRKFAWGLFVGVMECRPELDLRIESAADHWKLSRMAVTDRNVLRLGTFELLYTGTPHRVIINECVELAKKYGAAQSPPFVNGILDRLIPQDKRDQDRSRLGDLDEEEDSP